MKNLKLFSVILMLLVGIVQVWGGTGSITFDFEDDGAHRASGNNSYAAGPQSYSENSVDISCTYMDVVTTGTPLSGSANALGRVAKNTTNSPVLLIGPIDMTDKTITGITYYTKGVGTQSQVCEYSTNGSSWTTAVASFTMPTSSTQKSSGTISVAGTSTFYLRITTSVGSSTGSNRDLQIDDVVISYSYEDGGTPTCAAPTFTPAAGAVLSGTTVTFSTTTDGATIHYTTSGVDPTTSDATYSTPIEITSATTIKAIAVKAGNNNSAVATAAYTVLTPLTTMDEIFAAAGTAGSTATTVAITFDDWVVSGVSTNGKTVFLTNGTKGLMIYDSGASMGFAVGNILSGTAVCKVELKNGSAQLTALSSTTTGLSVATGGTAYLNVLDDAGIEALTGANTGSLIKISGECTSASSKYYVAGVQLYNTLFAFTAPTAGTNYECTGVFQLYNTTNEILPRSAADIVAQTSVATPTFTPAAGTYTSVQSVEIECTTAGATIYYTTNGDTPDNTSTEYTGAITVDATKTIKAIAYKGEDHSEVATAAYTINLPENEEVRKTWDLSIDETATASTTELTWTATYVSMSFAKGSGSTNANNYYPGTEGKTYTSTRAYTNGVITITPSGKQLTTVVFTATSPTYANALQGSTWTNATAVVDGSTVTVTATDGESAIIAVVGGTCGFTAVQVNYTDVDLTKPATPTFTPAAGTYTSVQSVEIECATAGATIYYTTNGDTPDNTSTEYTAAITVDANMTIKAIAIKEAKSSSIATAEYEINLPVSEEVQMTWDLSTDSYDADPTEDLIQWSATYVTMTNAKGTGTKVNNYIPTTQTSTRFYNGNELTITPTGKQITTIVFTATTNAYANALAGSTWTNGDAVADGTTVTVTVSAPGAVSAAITGTCGFTAVQVNYGPIDASIPDAPTFTPAAGTYTSVQSVEIECATAGATIYYTTNGDTPDNTSTEYTGAITVEETKTIKAVAIKDAKSSAVVTAAYTINLPLTTMDEIFAKADAVGTTATDVTIVFDNWVVSSISTNGKNVYLTDGSNGLVIFDNGGSLGFSVGDILSGTVACKVQKYNGFSEVTTLTSSSTGLTVTTGGVITPIATSIDALSGVNTGAPIIVNNVKFDGTNLTDGTNNIQPYTTLYDYTDPSSPFQTNRYYNVTGIYTQFNAKKEILPRSADDIEELTQEAPTMTWYTSSTKEVTIAANATYSIDLGDAFAPVFETNSEGEKTYTSSDPTIATIDGSTGALTLQNKVGSTIIKCAVAADAMDNFAADEQAFTLNVREGAQTGNVVILAEYDGAWYAMKNTFSDTKTVYALAVAYTNGAVICDNESDIASILWKRTVDAEGNTTFQNPSNNQYLKTSGNDLKLEASETGNYQWTWNDTYYRTGTQTRTFVYRVSANNGFRSYAVSNAGSSDYSELPIIYTGDVYVKKTSGTVDASTQTDGLSMIISNNVILNADAAKTLGSVIVEAGGTVSASSYQLTVKDFTINTQSGKSGQVLGTNVNVTGNLYLEIKLRDGDMDAEASRLWYCISAPFDVNMNGGFFWGDGTPMVLNTHFQLFEYDGQKRANTGNGWKRVNGTMKANTAYFIGFDDAQSNQNTIKLKANAKTIPGEDPIALNEYSAADEANANWNAVANPTLHYVGLDKTVQVFDPENQNYNPFPYFDAAYAFVVGTPFFYKGTGSIVLNTDPHVQYRAPQHRAESYNYCVQISKAETERFDNQLYVVASETAAATYEEGQDVPSMNEETSKYGALIWTENYGDKRLAIEEAPLVNSSASYVLGIYAPADGEYTISTPQAKEDVSLYLTREGRVIWDLTAAPYTLDLTKGNTTGYGLRIVAAPKATTDLEDVQGDKLQCTKVLINNHVFILRGEQLYDATGRLVK